MIIEDIDVQIIRTLDDMRSRHMPHPIRATAEALGLTQGRVRHRLFRAQNRLDGLVRYMTNFSPKPQRPN